MGDRDKQAGAAAAQPSILNPHNPDFLTKRPWYLGQDEAGASSAAVANSAELSTLDHQGAQHTGDTREELTLSLAERVLDEKRRREKELAQKSPGRFYQGQWVEALKKGKLPYRICQITNVHENKNAYDLEFEDGLVERQVKYSARASKPRIRLTKTGNRFADILLADKKETYASKRDAYHGYNKDVHNVKITAKFEEREALRREASQKNKRKQKKKNNDGEGTGDGDKDNAASSSDEEEDSDKDSEDGDDSGDEFVQKDEDDRVITTRLARQGGVGGAQMKVTARNLRIREDTAKYLRNLNANSAYYDPKSRSMRDNPHPEAANDASDFVGDNFARCTGDAVALAETQLFAWNAADRGVAEIHPQANPSQAELLKKEFKTKQGSLQLQRKKAVLDKYGGQEYLDGSGGLATAAAAVAAGTTDDSSNQKQASTAVASAVDRKLRFGVSTTVEEYSRDGRLLTSGGKKVKQAQVPLESKYQEDVFVNGHVTVWGSYFHKGALCWGYADDHSLLKNSYCTGENGRLANDEANEMRYGTGKAGSAALAQARGLLKNIYKPATTTATNTSSSMPPPPHMSRSKLYGEADPSADINQDQVKDALQRSLKREREDSMMSGDKKKKTYNSLKDNSGEDVTEADMEAFRLRKGRGSDPMAKVNSDQLLEYNHK